MTTCPSSPTHNSRIQRRTLRSNSKPMYLDNNPTAITNNDNLLNQIKFEIEHQQAINATKSSFPMQDDAKPFQSVIPALESPSLSVHNVIQQTCSFENFVHDVPLHKAAEKPPSSSEIFLEEKPNLQSELSKKQAYLKTPPTKSSSKIFKSTENSPYDQKRRSYRKIRKENNKCIPFRKCQEQLEQKIVVLINKICQKKHNSKEIDIFCDRLTKISLKDLYNPYVVSGVQAISNLLQQKSLQPDNNTRLRLINQVKSLSEKIQSQLENVDYYEEVIQAKKSVDLEVAREKVVRKVYKMLIYQRKCEPVMARMKSFEVCDSFFNQCNHQTSQEDLIDFLKQQNFLSV